MTATILVFVLTILAILGLHRLRTVMECSPSRERISRALNSVGPSSPAPSNVPSIVRRRPGRFGLSIWSIAGSHLPGLMQSLDELITAAGLRITIVQFLVCTGILSFILILLFLTAFSLPFLFSVFLGPLVALLSACGMLKKMRSRQVGRFQGIFPEALDLVVRSVRAGLPVSEAVKLIGNDVADPVGAAFREVAANLSIGLSLDEALTILRRKMPAPEVKFFSISLTIQQETGGNLAEILSNLSAIMRKRVQVDKKIRAMSSEAKASAIIIGSLPFFVGGIIYIFNRDYIKILFEDSTGQLCLLAAGGSMIMGSLIMRKLIKLEV